MSAHDRLLADWSKSDVHVTCAICDNEWEDVLETEYGAGWLCGNEECDNCGADGDDLRISDSEYEPDYEAMLEDKYGYEEYGQFEPW